MTRTSRIPLVAAAALAMCFALGCGKTPDNPQAGGSSPPGPGPGPNPAPVGDPDFKVDAIQFGREFAADENVAKQKYVNKIVEIEGVVRRLGHTVGGGTNVGLSELQENAGQLAVFRTTCYFHSTGVRKAKVLSAGQKVTIRGRCSSMVALESIRLLNCELIAAGPDPAIHIRAEQLAKEYAENQKQADEKYKNKFLVVRGIVREPATPGSETGLLVFQGAPEHPESPLVHAAFGGYSEGTDLVARLKKGDMRTIRGECFGLFKGKIEFLSPYLYLVPE